MALKYTYQYLWATVNIAICPTTHTAIGQSVKNRSGLWTIVSVWFIQRLKIFLGSFEHNHDFQNSNYCSPKFHSL